MHTARTDLIAHVEALGLGFLTVKPYAGEIAQAVQNGGVLTVPMPAALVLGKTVEAGPHATVTALDVLVVTQTYALDTEDGSTDALALAESLVDALRDAPDWTANGRRYVLDLNPGPRAETLAVTADYSIVSVSLTVEAR